MTNLSTFARLQENAVNEAAESAAKLLAVNPLFDVEAWFARARQQNPYFRGVSMREFGAAVLGIKPFEN